MPRKIFFLLAIVVFSGPQRLLAQLPPSNPDYKLVFHDEFDSLFPGSVVNSKLWARTPPWNQSSNMTENVAWCFPDDTTPRFWDRAYIIKNPADSSTVKVSNGTCKLVTSKTNYKGQVSNWPPCDPDHPGYGINGIKCQDSCKVRGGDNRPRCWTVEKLDFKYTTGMLYSKRTFRYGYFEIRFKLPSPPAAPYSHQGFGPNFWLYGNKPPVNITSEIDIFEIIAMNPARGDSNRYTSTVHYADKEMARRPNVHSEAIGNKLFGDTAWHIASAWWTPEFIKFYLDDSLYFTVQDNPKIPVDKLVDLTMLIDVNAPVSGRCNNFDPVHTQFPYVYEIDYVRVYQMK